MFLELRVGSVSDTFSDSFVIWSYLAASINARRLFFFGLEVVGGRAGDGDNKRVLVFI